MNLKRAIAGFILSFVFLAVFVYAISGVSMIFDTVEQGRQPSVLLGSVSDVVGGAATQAGQEINTTPPPEILAESAISVKTNLSDSDTVVFQKLPETKLPIASLTKLMTAIVVLDNYDLSRDVLVSQEAGGQEAMKQDVKTGDKMSAESFLKIMLITSSNKSAYALAEHMGVDKFLALMNQKAKDIGMENTYYADPTGLSARNVSTANDLVKLAEHILKKYPLIAQISKEQQVYLPGFGTIINTDQLLGEISEVVCSKTGFTTQAKGCLLLAVQGQDGSYIINVVLGADDRFSEMRKIINWSSSVCNLNQ